MWRNRNNRCIDIILHYDVFPFQFPQYPDIYPRCYSSKSSLSINFTASNLSYRCDDYRDRVLNETRPPPIRRNVFRIASGASSRVLLSADRRSEPFVKESARLDIYFAFYTVEKRRCPSFILCPRSRLTECDPTQSRTPNDYSSTFVGGSWNVRQYKFMQMPGRPAGKTDN